jgi:glycerophosphoryl diester phosphodiesterase
MRPLVIAHRGASGYLPESTLPAKALAVGMGADYVEHDVVMTRDDRLLINHDLWLDEVSDVARRFPGRERADGHFYVIDFDLDEILTLDVTDRFRTVGDQQVPVFPDRFPLWQSHFGFHTLESEFEFLRGVKRSSGRDVGVFTELKSPWFHEQEGKDLPAAVYDALGRYGYRTPEDRCRVMSFDAPALQRIRSDIAPAAGISVPLTQLICETENHETYERLADGSWCNYDYDWMFEPGGMERLREWADGIGPNQTMLLESSGSGIAATPMAARAHAAGLYVTPWTVRADQLPDFASSVDDLVEALVRECSVEGIITDFPDQVLRALEARG